MILEPVYLYCGRSGPGLWLEWPSLLASLAFLPAAWSVHMDSDRLTVLRPMSIGVALLFPATLAAHMLPSALTLAVPKLLVLLVVLIYFYGLNRDMLKLSAGLSLVSTLLILPFGAVSLALAVLLRGPGGSAGYVAMAVLLLGYGAVLRPECPRAARGLFRGALILGLALLARAADQPLCHAWPPGTHFLWLLCSAWLLAHLAGVYRRHLLAGQGGGG